MGYIIPDNTCASSVTPVYGYILMDMITDKHCLYF